MHKTFLRYHESVVQSGLLQLNPGLAKDVREMTETIANCIKSSNERTLDSDEDELGGEETSAPKSQSKAAQARPPTTTPEREQPRGHAATQQFSEPTQPKATTTEPESYLAHISSSSYDLPEPDHQFSLVRRFPSIMSETVDRSRIKSVNQQSRDASDRFQIQQYQQRQEHDQILPFGLVDLPSREQSPFMPPYIFPVHVPAMGAELPPAPRYSSPKPLPSSTTPLLTKTISPHYTYSYEEVTFARRLLRAALELGFSALSNPNIPPAILEHAYKLSLPYITLEGIRHRLKTILSRGVTEDLDFYGTPFLHLGGAGTHYQRRDAQGTPIPIKNGWTVRQIGPLDQRMIRMENVADGRTQDLEGIDLRGFEGEWFDSHDVEGYLEEQWHCKIDPRSSFAECLIDDETASFSDNETDSSTLSRSPTANTADEATPPALAPHAASTFQQSYGLDMLFGSAPTLNYLSATPKQSLLDLSFDQALGLDLAPGFDMGFAGSSEYSTLGLNTIGESDQLPVVRQRQKRVAWVDVQKMIDSEFALRASSLVERLLKVGQKSSDVGFASAGHRGTGARMSIKRSEKLSSLRTESMQMSWHTGRRLLW